ncbi:MAG: hypothetical protein KAR47_13760, partial [Planctomycetes bacterium]|nr:hypothetical protein [Planctomycetota bacterium]
KFKYNGNSVQLSVSRPSTAISSAFSEVPNNTPRVETVCAASRPEVTIFSRAAIVPYAVTADKVILTLSSAGTGKLFYTDDPEDPLSNVIEIVDIETSADFSDRAADTKLKSLVVLNDGSWLLSLGSQIVGSQGNLYRTEDEGASWTKVLTFPHGYTSYFAWCGIADNEILATEYGESRQNDTPRDVYYSNDYGQTWHLIYSPAPVWEQHCHLAAFKPGDTSVVYVMHGDRQVARWIKLKCTGDKTDINNWAIEKVLAEGGGTLDPGASWVPARFNLVHALTIGNSLYWGKDSGHIPLILKHDTTDDSISSVFNWPSHHGDLNHPYIDSENAAMVFGMCTHEGVHYAGVRGYAAPFIGAILASADGEHWAVAYRQEDPAYYGFRNVIGYMGGYLWGRVVGTDGLAYMFRMTPVHARNISAVRLERGIDNLIDTTDDSGFEGPGLDWSLTPTLKDIDTVASGRTTEEKLSGNYSYKLVLKDNDVGNGWAELSSPFVRPETGKYVLSSLWVKAGPNWPPNFQLRVYLSKKSSGGVYDGAVSKFRPLPCWQRVATWGKVIDGNFDVGSGMKLLMGVDYLNDGSEWEYEGDWSDATCYVDNVQIIECNDLHYYGSFHPGGSPRSDEHGAVPLTGLGESWTVSLEWKADSSSHELHNGAMLPVTSILSSDGSYINLTYDQNI